MLIDINEIIVNDRIRKDFGNLEELAEDIKKNGLINPLTVNGDYKLLAGERRLRACKLLGWNKVDVRVVKSNDEAHDLAVEMSENNLRRNFTGSELAEGIRRQMAIESEKAKERQQATQFGSDGGANIGTTAGKSRDKAAEQFGISGEQARKTLYVDDHKDMLDPADFTEWDEGKLSTNKAFQRIKAAMAQAEKERAEAESERKRIERELKKASIAQTNLEMEAESLRQRLVEKPEPEVIEREVEVVREVIPEDVRRRIESLEYDNQRYSDDYQRLRKRNEELHKELGRVKGLISMGESARDVQRDVEYLIAATNQFVRNYGGLTWTFEQIGDVDEATRSDLRKAIKNLATFSSALMTGLEQM